MAPPTEEHPSGVQGQASSGAINDGNEGVISSSSLPQSLKFWADGTSRSRASKGASHAQTSRSDFHFCLDFRTHEASFSLVGALSMYRSFKFNTQEPSPGSSDSSENKKNNDQNSSVNFLSLFAAFLCAGKAMQTTSNASTKAFQGSHSKKGNFQYRRDSFLEDDWESRKTRLINVESLAARIRDVSFEEESVSESSPKRVTSLDRICSTLFSTGSAGKNTHYTTHNFWPLLQSSALVFHFRWIGMSRPRTMSLQRRQRGLISSWVMHRSVLLRSLMECGKHKAVGKWFNKL